ncbi:MAG TPA: AmmeMemoRadiSam system radical SAM enzyme [Bacteroidales bacterium]|nr:AmmeMemoRadiSam system radical SAM enzyme [Bacteroidales bacterium]HOX74327.1 AmmeMemoRadiSam system radical SAM enzyme [Bacteroidales bacterium]HPM87916.1 AmmeMemoRadiSam system radical SAM enzyme [Bacteroidales bacterium]HQM68915.1 AmmeMemoRadiSam system radical SAM enzyme [Bacteroidales bacterium]
MAKCEFNSGKRVFIKKCLALSAGITAMPGRVFLNDIYSEEQSGRRIAMFQEETPRGVMCLICPNECVLKEGEVSQCNNRIVRNSKLYTMAFGNPCSVNVDPMEKKPLYHFLPGSRAYSIATAGCNLACLNCQNWTISQTRPDRTRNYDLMPERVVEEAVKNSCRSIAYTYSEPVSFFEYAYETASLARKAGVKNVIKSNGYVNPEPLRKLCTVADAANIDLKSFRESTYLKLSGGKLQPVLEALKIYRDSGVWLEITNLVVPSWTDKPEEIAAMCKWLSENGFKDNPIHFSRFYPVYKLDQLPPTPVELLNNAAKIARAEGLRYVYTGNIPGNEQANTLCPGCGTTLIIREGYRVVTNNISGGRCHKCGREIRGIWT